MVAPLTAAASDDDVGGGHMGSLGRCQKPATLSASLASSRGWAPYHTRVNVIAPGYIQTELMELAARSGHIDLPVITVETPAERLGDVAEIAELAGIRPRRTPSGVSPLRLRSFRGTWLCGARCEGVRSAFITGQLVTIDGGFTLTK